MRRILIFLSILSGFSLIFGQSIDCVFSGNYQCALVLNNPNGFDNFTLIGGAHLENKTNADVVRVTRQNGTSRNFPAIICESFPNLEAITVGSAQIQTLTQRAFAACANLLSIIMTANRITTPPVDLLVHNPKLQVFRVYTNNIIDALPVGLFDSTPDLNFFCHEDNPTGVLLPEIFRGLTKMETLHIYNMQLAEMPSCLLRPMEKLRLFYGSSNQLKVIHQKSFPPTKNHLTNIHLNNNKIEAIDRRIFDQTPLLSVVDLSSNNCTSRSFSNFNSNRTYYLSLLEPCFAEYDRRFPTDDSGSTCNFVEHPVYGYTCELINFNASNPILNNHLDCLSDSDVTGVIFTSTQIEKIPSQLFPTFPNLKYIQAIDAGLETALIENCGANLKFIDVSRNSIRELPSDAFECENIETIVADFNCIKAVQSCEKSFMENSAKLKKVSIKGAACVDAEFDLERQSKNEIGKALNKCFGLWFLR